MHYGAQSTAEKSNTMHMRDLRIRNCRHSDLDMVSRIDETCFGTDGALSRIAFTQYLELFGPAFVVGESLTDIVAFAVGGAAISQTGNIGWLLDVAVLPKCQGQGIGPALCKHVLDELHKVGVRTVRATVSPQNRRSLHMLVNLGFSVVDDVADYFGSEQRRFIMERQYERQ